MTIVWRTESGTLIQTPVGTIDVLNTYSAAQAIYGWMGGADSARFLLLELPNPLSRRIKQLRLAKLPRLIHYRGYVQICHRFLVAHIVNA